MKEFLEVRKNNVQDQEKISAWALACGIKRMPSVIIYYDEEIADISASILPLTLHPSIEILFDVQNADRYFFSLTISATSDSRNYWNHNDMYFTFDNMAKEKAPTIAAQILEILRTTLEIKSRKSINE